MIGAIIGGLIGVAGAALGASAQKKAAKQASDAQLQVAQQNNALAREFRASNEANFQPNLQSGFRANSLLDSFLYGPQAAQPAPAAPAQQMAPGGAQAGIYNTQPAQGFQLDGMVNDLGIGSSYGGYTATNAMGVRNLQHLQQQQAAQQPVAPVAAAPQAMAPAGNAMSGWEAFQASPYYQFPLAEGQRAYEHGFAAKGMFDLGQLRKELTKYGQNYAAGRQDEFLGLAERQANRGVQGAGAIAGVGMNTLNAISGNNQNAADAASNAALLRGQANAGMWSGIGNALGGVAGSFGSSYRGF